MQSKIKIGYDIDYGVFSSLRDFYTSLDDLIDYGLNHRVKLETFQLDEAESIYFNIENAIEEYEY